jgi:hypothetical protein
MAIRKPDGSEVLTPIDVVFEFTITVEGEVIDTLYVRYHTGQQKSLMQNIAYAYNVPFNNIKSRTIKDLHRQNFLHHLNAVIRKYSPHKAPIEHVARAPTHSRFEKLKAQALRERIIESKRFQVTED